MKQNIIPLQLKKLMNNLDEEAKQKKAWFEDNNANLVMSDDLPKIPYTLNEIQKLITEIESIQTDTEGRVSCISDFDQGRDKEGIPTEVSPPVRNIMDKLCTIRNSLQSILKRKALTLDNLSETVG